MERVEDSFFKMREKIFNQTVVVSFFIVLLVIIPSVFRAVYSGFQRTHFLILCSLVFLVFIYVFRNRLHYYVRLSIFVSFFSAIGCSGLYNFGLLGDGAMMLLLAPLLLTIFASRRSSWILLAVQAVFIVIVMFLYASGRKTWSFDPFVYHTQIGSWLTMLTGIVVYTAISISITGNLLSKLRSLITELSQKVVDIRNLNETLEQQVESRTAELVDANKEKDRILGVVAHDIRNKLIGISGYLEMLLDQDLALDEEKKLKYLQKALEGSVVSGDIVKDLLGFAKIQGEAEALEMECIDIVPLIQSSVEDYLFKATEKGVAVINETGEKSFICNINSVKFSRVIDNLVSNAIKFTHSGDTVSIDIKRQSDGTLVRISDTGIGIPYSLKSDIFHPFSSSGRPGTENEGSTGLGLSICEKIMNKHNGKIWVESEEGKGSTFFLLLPSVSSGS